MTILIHHFLTFIPMWSGKMATFNPTPPLCLDVPNVLPLTVMILRMQAIKMLHGQHFIYFMIGLIKYTSNCSLPAKKDQHDMFNQLPRGATSIRRVRNQNYSIHLNDNLILCGDYL